MAIVITNDCCQWVVSNLPSYLSLFSCACYYRLTVLITSHQTVLKFPHPPLVLFFSFWFYVMDSGEYKGIIEDCCCDYETVDNINGEVLHPLLQELVTTPLFRYFKV